MNSDDVCSTITNESKEEVNPYAYLDRSEFTSEKYKIEIRGLPKYYGISELKKLLNDKLKLGSNKIKPPRRGSHWVYICFRNDDDRRSAISVLNGYLWKGKKLQAEEAKPAPDPLVRKRQQQLLAGADPDGKKQKLDERSQEERLKSSTTPYWDLSYEKQLIEKHADVRKVLLKLANELWRANPLLRPWIEKQRKLNKGLPCELWDIRSAAKHEGYRTKCEFTVGMDDETKLKTVGFRLGSYVTGFTGVGPVDNLIHIPDRMKVAVKAFETFVRSSELEVFSPEFQSGQFRVLTARWSTHTDELMLIVGVQTKDMDEAGILKLKSDLTIYFTTGDGKDANVTSLYFQIIQKKTPDQVVPKIEHLMGTTHIQESVLGLKFRISPEAFFQVNTNGAEVLYSSAIELTQPNQDSTIVDICCGTGTIGLCFAKHSGQVLGLELISEAVTDAKANALSNSIDNAEFFDGRAEDILSSVMAKATNNDIIAIVDPPRAGLHHKAVVQLRQTKKLSKLLYVSCDPAAAIKNFIDLGRPASKNLHREPIVPIKAVAVDMFPYTKHCELLIYFERFKMEEKPLCDTVETQNTIVKEELVVDKSKDVSMLDSVVVKSEAAVEQSLEVPKSSSVIVKEELEEAQSNVVPKPEDIQAMDETVIAPAISQVKANPDNSSQQ